MSAIWFKIPMRQQAFLSWAGLRGAVPIVLTTIPLAERHRGRRASCSTWCWCSSSSSPAPGADPAPGRPPARVDRRPAARDVEVEAAPLDKISADLLQVRIPAGSRLAGVEIGELRLPEHTVVSLIIRDERAVLPGGRERIKVGDELLIVTPTTQRDTTEDRLRALGAAAGWPAGGPTPD